jgi:hypothetical protein
MYSKMAISACRLVSQDCRQISSALMVLKKVSTAAVVTITLAAHGHLEAMLAQDLLIIMRTILASYAGIWVMA